MVFDEQRFLKQTSHMIDAIQKAVEFGDWKISQKQSYTFTGRAFRQAEDFSTTINMDE